MQKVVLAFSGGLDTSVAIKWIQEKYNMEVVTLTVDVGANDRDLESIRERALEIGAVKALVRDVKEEFVKFFIWPALKAGAIYEGEYPLATALARPLIAWHLVQVARQEGASAVAHGCTGKGNDQVRFDLSVNVLAPDLKIIAPVREWRMTRDEEIKYAREKGIQLQDASMKRYSVDQNLWGRSVEAGVLEDPWVEAPEDAYAWTAGPTGQPDEPQYLTIDFEKGLPVALDGERLDGVTLITRLNQIAGKHGIGRIDHMENRLVGIKSREIYEAPAGVVLHKAHNWLEDATLTRESARFKARAAQEYADLVYNGLWFSPLHQDLAAYVASSQRYVTGTIKVKLFRGSCYKAGVQSPKSLYNFSLATYDKGDQYNHDAAIGFINIFGLSMRNQSQIQLGAGSQDVKEEFVKFFIWPALKAGAIYEGEYPLATALARPLIAWHLVQVARQEGASAVAHGCTGKGNDQVRFDLSVNVLAPDLKIIAPVREWRMTRDEEIKYAREKGIQLQDASMKRYSVDQNLWGRSVEAGVLEDPWVEAPEDAYAWTAGPTGQPDEPQYLTIDFEKGLPVALDGERLDGVTLITRLNQIAGKHGIGRIDHMENRLVGIKSREIYEAPAGVVLHKAHNWLEDATLTRESARFKARAAQEYADLVYNGLWFSPLHQDLAAYVASSQRYVTGTIKVKLFRGSCYKAGVQSPKSLYNFSLATYDKGDQYNHDAAIGFINIFGLSMRNQSQIQLGAGSQDELLSLNAPDYPGEESKG